MAQKQQPDTVNVQLPLAKDAQSGKASGSGSSRVVTATSSTSKAKAKQAEALPESDNESETWTAGEDEDDSRPPLSAVKSDKQQQEAKSAPTRSQLKRQKKKRQQELKDQQSSQQSAKASSKADQVAAVKGKLPDTSTLEKPVPTPHSSLPPPKPAKRQNLMAPREQKMFVPPAFAATAPSPSDLLECYNEPDSKAITKFSKDGDHKTQMHLRVSLRPLPKLQSIPPTGSQRQQYKKSMGVVEVDLVVQSRKNRNLPADVKTPQIYSQNNEPVSVGYQSRKRPSPKQADVERELEAIIQQNTAVPIIRPSSAPPIASSVVSLSDHLAGSLSLSGSSVASTSIATPPLPSKAEETTFYTSSPALEVQDSAIINLGRRLEAEEKPSFIPASTAVISTSVAPPPLTIQQQHPDTTLRAQLDQPAEEAQDDRHAHAALALRHGNPVQHSHIYRPVQQHGYAQPVYYGHGQSQPFQAMDGTFWQLNAYGHAVPYYGYSAGAMYGPAVQQPFFHQQPQHYQVIPHGNPAVQHLSEARGAQPYDSPPYSPHDTFSPLQHQHTGHSAGFSHSTSLSKALHNPASYAAQGFYPATSASSSSSSAVASHHQQYPTQQPHPLSLPPQMPSPIYPYPSQGSGYTYDPETGLMTDETGLVFPPQHQPIMQSYHGPVRPLSEFNASNTEGSAY